MSSNRRLLLSLVCAAAFVAALGVAARAHQGHVMANVADAKWGPAPPFIPAGAEIAVLSGDPTKPVPYSVRLKFPANYRIQAHSHPTDENVTVVSGTFYMGAGNKLDPAAGTPLSVGGYCLVPAGFNHYAYTKAPVTIVLYGQGPVDFKYVNPKDDPRNK